MPEGKTSKFDLIIGAVDRFSGVFGAFNGKVAAAQQKVAGLQKAFSGLSRATGMATLGSALKLVGSSMRNVVTEGQALVSTVTGLVGKLSLLFGAAGGGIFALAKSTASAGDAAAKAAARAGVGVRTWQEYAHAAILSDVSTEQLQKTFVKLQDTAIKAFQGDKTAGSILKLAGINPKTAKGEVKNADTLMLELADKVKRLNEAGQQAKAVNLVKQIFGDEGTKLMPLLNGGAAGLKDMRLEAHKLGLVLGEEDAKNSEAFNDAITRGLGALKGMGYALGRVLLPPLTKLLEKFTNWAAAQREVMTGGFAEWVEQIDIDALWQSIERGFATLSRFAGACNSIAKALGGWENVALGLVALLSGKFLYALGLAVVAIAKLGLAFLATPIGWLVAGIAAIAGGAYLIYKNWDGVAAWFTQKWEAIKSAFSEGWINGVGAILREFNPFLVAIDAVSGFVRELTGFDLKAEGARFIKSLGEGVTQAWDDLWASVQSGAAAAWAALAASMEQYVAPILDFFRSIDLADAGRKLVESFKNGIAALWDGFVGWVRGKVEGLLGIFGKIGGFLGLGGGTAASAAAPAQPVSMDSPVDMGNAGRGVVQTQRTEHVEREKIELVVRAADGAQVSGARQGGGGSGLSLQTGQVGAW